MDFPKIWEQTEPYIGEWAQVIFSPASVLLFAALFLVGLGVFLSPDNSQPDGPYRSDDEGSDEESDEDGSDEGGSDEESDGGDDGSDSGRAGAGLGSRGRRRIA